MRLNGARGQNFSGLQDMSGGTGMRSSAAPGKRERSSNSKRAREGLHGLVANEVSGGTGI
jgi:hypothetical protein